MTNKGYGRKCGAPGCTRANRVGGLCLVHIQIRDQNLPMAESVWIARRLANVKQVGDCIIWQGAPNNMGYGKVGVANDPSAPGNEEAVHRWFYKRLVGPIPEGLMLDHLCRTPLCVNVKHLEPVTQIENDRRGQIARGYGPARTHCKHGHPWVPENLTRAKAAPGVAFDLWKCRPCNTIAKRKKNGHNARPDRKEQETSDVRNF